MYSQEDPPSSPIEDAVREYSNGMQQLENLRRRGMRNTSAYKKLKRELLNLWTGELQNTTSPEAAQSSDPGVPVAGPSALHNCALPLVVVDNSVSHENEEFAQNTEVQSPEVGELGGHCKKRIYNEAARNSHVNKNEQFGATYDDEDDHDDDDDEVIDMGEQAASYQWLRNIMDSIGNGLTSFLNPQDSKQDAAAAAAALLVRKENSFH
jgi:hypothetical protein